MSKFLSIVLIVVLSGAALTDVRADEPKTSEVKAQDLTLTVPADWKQVPSASRMRLVTLEIPPVKGDSDPGELTVFSFPGGGGGIEENLKRWVNQFSSEGRKSTVAKGSTKSGSNYYLADVSGTYNKPDGPPILRKTVATPGYRMLAVILNLEGKGVYYLKLTGPDATIKAQAKAFRSSFGGDGDSEEEFEEGEI